MGKPIPIKNIIPTKDEITVVGIIFILPMNIPKNRYDYRSLYPLISTIEDKHAFFS